jgi:hypothetical protein
VLSAGNPFAAPHFAPLYTTVTHLLLTQLIWPPLVRTVHSCLCCNAVHACPHQQHRRGPGTTSTGWLAGCSSSAAPHTPAYHLAWPLSPAGSLAAHFKETPAYCYSRRLPSTDAPGRTLLPEHSIGRPQPSLPACTCQGAPPPATRLSHMRYVTTFNLCNLDACPASCTRCCLSGTAEAAAQPPPPAAGGGAASATLLRSCAAATCCCCCLFRLPAALLCRCGLLLLLLLLVVAACSTTVPLPPSAAAAAAAAWAWWPHQSSTPAP